MFRSALLALLASAAAILAARAAFGPFGPVRSPLAAESLVAAAFFLGCFAARPAGFAPLTAAPRWALAIVLIVIAFAFAWALPFNFLSDDYILAGRKLDASGIAWSFVHAGGDGFFRPVGTMVRWLHQQIAGTDPARWHAANLLWHLANTALVYALGRRLYGPWPALVAAALFGIGGARPEAVHWAAGLFDLAAAFFTLVALNLLARSHYAAGLLAFAAALLTKESAYIAPALLILLLYSTNRQPAKRDLLWIAALFALALAAFGYRWMLLGGVGGYEFHLGIGTLKALAVRIWAVLLFPINWSRAPEAWLAAALLLFLAALLFAAVSIRTAGRRRMLLLAASVIVAALPAAPLALIGADLLGSRVLYLPSIPFSLLLGTIFQSIPAARWRDAAAAAAIIFNLAALEHNLAIWGRVSRLARQTCLDAAHPALRSSIDGVFFFANGFEDCVTMRRSER